MDCDLALYPFPAQVAFGWGVSSKYRNQTRTLPKLILYFNCSGLSVFNCDYLRTKRYTSRSRDHAPLLCPPCVYILIALLLCCRLNPGHHALKADTLPAALRPRPSHLLLLLRVHNGHLECFGLHYFHTFFFYYYKLSLTPNIAWYI